MDNANNDNSKSLADKVVEAQAREAELSPAQMFDFFDYDLPEHDEFGMPTANSIEYVIARILYIDHNISGRETLHLRQDNHIWEGDHWVAENDINLYRLTQWKFKGFNRDQKARIWARLRGCLPTLSNDKLVIKNNLVWNMKENKLEYTIEDPLTIN